MGKEPCARLTIRARLEESDVSIEVEDDGRGIDWDAIRSRALSMNLPAPTAERRNMLAASRTPLAKFVTNQHVTEIASAFSSPDDSGSPRCHRVVG